MAPLARSSERSAWTIDPSVGAKSQRVGCNRVGESTSLIMKLRNVRRTHASDGPKPVKK